MDQAKTKMASLMKDFAGTTVAKRAAKDERAARAAPGRASA